MPVHSEEIMTTMKLMRTQVEKLWQCQSAARIRYHPTHQFAFDDRYHRYDDGFVCLARVGIEVRPEDPRQIVDGEELG